jgi:hypothetical protein
MKQCTLFVIAIDISCAIILLALCYTTVFLAIRQYFWPSASIFCHPPVFLAIRQYFLPSASISRYPPVFIAIRIT